MLGPSRGRLGASILLAAFALSPAAAVAQRFGQWSWEGELGLGQESFQTHLDGSRLRDYKRQDLRLSLGLNGFVVHPAVGRFRLGLDLQLSELGGDRALDSDRYGARGDLELFSRGGYPIRLFFDRRLYRYAGLDGDDPFTLLGFPDTLTRWGGRVRARRGPLRGTLVGFEHTGYDLLAPGADRDVDDRQFVDWSGASGKLRHHVRLERRQREFGAVDLSLEDLILNFDQRGDLSPSWRWETLGTGFDRASTVGGGAERDTAYYSLRNRLYQRRRERDLLDLRYGFSRTEQGSGQTSDRHLLSVFYRWFPVPAWEISPFGEFGEQRSPALSVRSPRVGLVVSRRGRGAKVQSLLTARASYGTVDRSGPGAAGDDSRLGLSLTGSIAQGSPRGLRKQLEVEASRDELRLAPGPALDFPDLGLPAGGFGTEDQRRARLTLSHTWDSRFVSAYGEWSHRETTAMAGVDAFAAETVSANLQLGGRRFNLQANSGESRIDQPELGDQDVRFVTGSASWRPTRWLSLRGVYRNDRRQLSLVPTIDGEQLELQLRLSLGMLDVEVRGWQTEQRPQVGESRTSEGLSLSITRRFAGWLPIVTGAPRRGVIR